MTTPKILLIEDDLELAELTQIYLSQQGFKITHRESAEQALLLSTEHKFELIICDIMLPGLDGFSALPRLSERYQCTLIFMSALDGQEEQIKGLNIGASDYIVKPIHPQLLTARINAHLRKAQKNSSNAKLEIGDFCINEDKQEISVGEQQLDLTTQEYNLLKVFARNNTYVLSREYLFEQYVGRPYDGLDRAVDLKISRLRKKLDSYNIDKLTIKTVHGKGYLFYYQPTFQDKL